ncbi:hypothetical protein [Lichenibacterium dinghuense]|uniref:hypothetical protein n=1 Tax=Lichenibacterium dinghuense TaxID=2895977 RepID=UPI0028168F9B|nr:hypothetical protein [Lichenibacterium sp. 6Y81]
MTIFIAAWHYWARMVVQRTWGWSPVEELVLLHVDKTPGTIESIRTDLSLSPQVVGATIARLMQFGLIELQTSPRPLFSTSAMGRETVRTGRPLPERTADREISVSLVYERVGRSIFRRRAVKLRSASDIGPVAGVVRFDRDEPDENDETMSLRAARFMAGTLRPGEWLRGTKAVNSVITRRYLEIDLADARDGVFPEGASDALKDALRATLATGVLPVQRAAEQSPMPSVEVELGADDLILGAREQLNRFVEIVDRAERDVFVLSTFVASQNDEKGREERDHLLNSLDRAVKRGVRCHLFFGTSLDEGAKHASAMQEIKTRLSAGGLIRGTLLVHRDPVRSHAKVLAADDGDGGAVVLVGSCNWLSTPFNAVELSVRLGDGEGAAVGLDLLRSIVVALPEASRSVESLRFMAAEARRRSQETAGRREVPSEAKMTSLSVVYAADHERLLRRAAHEASTRFICCTNRVGANMVPALFTPAEVAGRRLDDVRVLYSRHTGPTKRRHIAEHRERLHGIVKLLPYRNPQLHCKFLLWDDDNVVVSMLNWGSQSGRADDPLDEVGIHIQGSGIAVEMLGRLERIIEETPQTAIALHS